MIFVDTGAWFAAFVPNDPDHLAADAWLAQNRQPLVTTDFVLDELGPTTALKPRPSSSLGEPHDGWYNIESKWGVRGPFSIAGDV